MRARGADESARRRALGEMCEAYWYPLYAWLRHSGRPQQDAEDLAQEFFVRLMDGRLLGAADPARGKFRTLLLTALHGQQVNAWQKEGAQKRGGGSANRIPLEGAEEKWLADASRDGAPDVAFDRAWAVTVADRASLALQADYTAAGKAAVFAELFPRVTGGRSTDGLREAGLRLGLTEAAVKMTLSRMRQRFADALRAEIAETVGSQEDLQEELRYLLALFL